MENYKVDYYGNGKIESESYYNNGEHHRENLPAVIWYHENGKIESEYYYLCGEEYDKDEFDNIMNISNKIKLDSILAIMNIKHKSKYIRNICQEVINERL